MPAYMGVYDGKKEGGRTQASPKRCTFCTGRLATAPQLL